VREAKKRALGLCLFYVEMVGAMVLHHCMISEMKIGKGKTLAVAIAVYLSTLEGKGVHVHEHFLGLSVGIIIHGLTDSQRREQYACDVTYATNNELGFDYL